MISNADIQSAWVARLKANAVVTARVPATEIREDSWKGQTFTYPNIRVRLVSLAPTIPNNNCLIFRSEVSIHCYSEQKSSRLADQIAGDVATEFWGHPYSSGLVKFTAINLTSVVPAYVPEWDENSWISEVNFECLVQSI